MQTQQLTFTRYFVALFVVVFHFGGPYWPIKVPYVGQVLNRGDIGVSYFFLLSGLVMVLAYGRRDKPIEYGEFYRNRVARILPLYYLAMVMMVAYYVLRVHVLKMPFPYHDQKPEDVALNVLVLQSWIPHKALTVNQAAWSISVEALFYAVFPLLFNAIYRRFSLKAIGIAIVGFYIASQVVFYFLMKTAGSLYSFYHYHPLLHLNEFLVGNLMGLLLYRYSPKQRNYALPIALILVGVVAALYFQIPGLDYHNGLFVIALFPLLYFMTLDTSSISQFFRKDFMLYLGEVSYGVYILQFPVFYFFTAGLTLAGFKINQNLFYLYLVVLTAFSALTYSFFERPLRERIKRWKV